MRAASYAVKHGYTKVYSFNGGIPEWRKFNYPMVIDPAWQVIKVKKLSPAAFKSMMDDNAVYILDVRPLNFKRDRSFIPGAHHCPLVFLEERYRTLPLDQDLLLTDWAMRQSPVAAKFLIINGYRVKGVLKGGMERWKSESHPFEERDPILPPGSMAE
jgi:rhodanese-related sulfurtransferase